MEQQELENIDIDYIPWREAIRILCNIDSKKKRIAETFLKGLQELEQYFEVVKLKKPFFYKEYHSFCTIVVSKKDVLKFKEIFISRLEAFPMQSYYSRKDKLEIYLKRKNVEIVRIAQKDNLVFYKRKGFFNFLKTISVDGLIYQEHLCKKYDITLDKWKRIDKIVNLEKISTDKHIYYKEKDVDDLLSSIRLGIDDLYEKYYSATCLKNKHNLTRNHIKSVKSIRDKEIEVPLHYRPLLPYADNSYFYDKGSVDEHLKQRAFYSVAATDPYDAYKYKITLLEIVFPEHLSKTEELWEDFAKDYLRSRKQNTQTSNRTINLLSGIAKIISGLTTEIFRMTSNEINLLFFNGEYTKEYKKVLYFFVKAVYNYFFEVFQIQPFNISKINSDHTKKSECIKEKEIYEIQEYRLFHDYASDLNLHKGKAIEDVLKHAEDPSMSFKYDSAWLYILLHLNNGWRHSDVVYKVPRIDLTKTKIKDLNWLKNNQIDEEDMKIILYQVKRKVSFTNHSKNNAERFFFWSEALAPSLANALAICELRTQIANPNAKHLVNFRTKNQEFTKRTPTYREFFKSFNSSIIFESLKMNRTLLSYAFSILKRNNPKEALAASQHLRGHLDKETTNVYVMIPQNEMDFLVEQLFERDNFGYIPYVIANILMGEGKRDLKLQTEQIKAIKEAFGGIYKIEFFASFLNDIISERVDVEEILKSAELYEIEALNFKLITKQLPAKQKNFQCLVSTQGCQQPEIQDCSKCLFSIPNYYALSGITQRLKERVLTMLMDFQKLEFETDKVRYAKLFNRDMLLLKDAIDKYGKVEVFEVMDISIEDYRLLLSEIPSLKKYLESGKK